MKRMIHWMIQPPVTGPASIFIIRLIPGAVLAYEGIADLTTISPGISEIPSLVFAIAVFVESLLLAGGLYTRLAALLAIIHPTVAIFFKGGISCCDYAQIMAAVFIAVEGPGRCSLDFYIATNREPIFKINQNK